MLWICFGAGNGVLVLKKVNMKKERIQCGSSRPADDNVEQHLWLDLLNVIKRKFFILRRSYGAGLSGGFSHNAQESTLQSSDRMLK